MTGRIAAHRAVPPTRPVESTLPRRADLRSPTYAAPRPAHTVSPR
ncbi:hypothetical protein Tbis_3241 [Thermobispora bispora DSM 43833]|jgi:hypothetical protein|uniref:Uncharacterized protein n=1 Tax=Thermobispora bispora (strain ATCC 19993 / DSM 43833 / CBS 139.67 / JCM 10125 / KCTC 9307 / NBRC 14880 / R51) TaxID=469371 RepID=D6Y8W9_THEBD|nr:hypothetical protein Tbis_3241 [Thermobispora bispora DSM 43833]